MWPSVPQQIIRVAPGPDKKDLNRPPNFVLYLGAKINLAFDLIVSPCAEG